MGHIMSLFLYRQDSCDSSFLGSSKTFLCPVKFKINTVIVYIFP